MPTQFKSRKTRISVLSKEEEEMLAKEKDSFVSPRSNTLSQQTIDLVVQDVATATELLEVQVLAAICILLQMILSMRSMEGWLCSIL